MLPGVRIHCREIRNTYTYTYIYKYIYIYIHIYIYIYRAICLEVSLNTKAVRIANSLILDGPQSVYSVRARNNRVCKSGFEFVDESGSGGQPIFHDYWMQKIQYARRHRAWRLAKVNIPLLFIYFFLFKLKTEFRKQNSRKKKRNIAKIRFYSSTFKFPDIKKELIYSGN